MIRVKDLMVVTFLHWNKHDFCLINLVWKLESSHHLVHGLSVFLNLVFKSRSKSA